MNLVVSWWWASAAALPLSHDELVHGKGSLLQKMPGDRAQRFANRRAYHGFMWAHPGKKLLFMGGEFAQDREWSHAQGLAWHLLDDPAHAGMQHLVRDLARLYRDTPALHQLDGEAAGFEWIDHHDAEHSVLSFICRGRDDRHFMVVDCKVTPVPHHGWRVGVPRPDVCREGLNTEAAHYGGSNLGQPFGAAGAQPVPAHRRAQSIQLTLPPLATMFLEWRA